VSWRRLVPAAAAVLLVVGAGLGGFRLGQLETGNSSDADLTQTTYYSETTDDEETEPDELTVQVLLDDFALDRRLNASEYLLDDISEEEMQYLASNFDIGEIL
jgi:hypothetical protein